MFFFRISISIIPIFWCCYIVLIILLHCNTIRCFKINMGLTSLKTINLIILSLSLILWYILMNMNLLMYLNLFSCIKFLVLYCRGPINLTLQTWRCRAEALQWIWRKCLLVFTLLLWNKQLLLVYLMQPVWMKRPKSWSLLLIVMFWKFWKLLPALWLWLLMMMLWLWLLRMMVTLTDMVMLALVLMERVFFTGTSTILFWMLKWKKRKRECPFVNL